MLSDKKPSCGQLLGPTESGQPRQFNETVDDPALGWAWKIDVRLAPTSGAKATFPDRCFVQEAAYAVQQNCSPFDHLVGGSEERRWHGEPEHPGGLHVDD